MAMATSSDRIRSMGVADSQRFRLTVGIFLPLIAVCAVTISLCNFSISRSLQATQSQELLPRDPVRVALDDFRHDDPSVVTKLQYIVEAPIENPPLENGTTTFSACMLVMDDNHRLAEWMAYHTHILPLRTMIVAIDPRSKTSPTFIFNRWRRQGVYIEEWGDTDFWVKKERRPILDNDPFQTKRDRHRGRQKFFYKKCLIHLKEMNRTWVTTHDTDEYLVYNHASGDKFEAWMKKSHNRMRLHDKKAKHIQPAMIPPSPAEPGAMIRYLNHERDAGLEYYQSPCIGLPRLTFGATESLPEERAKDIPQGWNDTVEQLDTLRWRKHAWRNDFVKNLLGKVLFDVSRVDVANSPYFMSLHRPIKSICPTPWAHDWESGLRLNHYLGSWESYSFRDDARRGGERSVEQWEFKATMNQDETDDNIRPWLTGFVQQHGQSKAKELLKDAGLPKGYKRANGTAWVLLPQFLDKILQANDTVSQSKKTVHFEKFVRNKYNRSDSQTSQE